MENNATFSEMILITLFLGLLAYVLGMVIQLIVVIRFKKLHTWRKLLLMLLLSRLLSIMLSLIIWKYWFLEIDIMQGPFFVPSVIAEIIISPSLLYLFRYRKITN